MEGEYEIDISIPKQYPDSLPLVFEIGGKIDRNYHHNPTGELCLATPIEIEMNFKKFPSLLGFVDNLVIPYLFSHAYFMKHGEMPYGERPHGSEGILQFYEEHFGTNDSVRLSPEINRQEILHIGIG